MKAIHFSHSKKRHHSRETFPQGEHKHMRKEVKQMRKVKSKDTQNVIDMITHVQTNARQKGRSLTPAEGTKVDTALRVLEQSKRNHPEDAAAIDEWLNADAPWNGPAEKPDVGDGGYRPHTGLRAATQPGIEHRKFNALFGETAKGDGGFDSMSDFMDSIHRGLADTRLVRAMSEGVPADGGFLCPDDFAKEIFDVSLEDEVVRPRATVYPMTTLKKKIPALAIGDHSSNIFGGCVCSWTAEGGTISEASPTTRLMELTANKLTALAEASNELIEDGINVESQVMGVNIPKAIGWYLDRDFLTGDGAGKPLGVLNAPCLISIAKEVGQGAATIVYENLIKMLAQLHPACWKKAIWVAHPTCVPQLLTLSVAVGAGGSHIPVMTESSGKFSMLGRPVVFSEKCETLGTAGDLMLADFSQYAIGLRKDVRLDKSGHVYFTSDRTLYRCIIRVDGQPLWNETLTLEDGSTEVSPFLVIAERA